MGGRLAGGGRVRFRPEESNVVWSSDLYIKERAGIHFWRLEIGICVDRLRCT